MHSYVHHIQIFAVLFVVYNLHEYILIAIFMIHDQETIEINRKNITVAMMKNYPQLLRKYMVDDAKVPLLVEIIVYMNLELYSLKRQEQVCYNLLQCNVYQILLQMSKQVTFPLFLGLCSELQNCSSAHKRCIF